jgi:hypothetical protein
VNAWLVAVYSTIWISLLLFAIGETGRTHTRPGTAPPSWAWYAFFAGWLLAIVHTLLAFGVIHDWNHDDAVRNTALQTEAMFGIAFGGGLYVNYVFFAVWLADAVWWRTAPALVRPVWATVALHAFYMVIIFNAAVVFAPGVRRIFGAVLVSWLARLWAPGVLQSRPRRQL